MSEKVKVGFIGAGGMSNRVHYPSLAEFEDVEIAAVCDIDESKLDARAEEYNIRESFTDYPKMLKEVDLDVVYIVMPPMGLKDIVLDCLGVGKHVFVEKPPGVITAETKEMADSAKGLKTMVGFNRRFGPVMRETKKIVEERGKVCQIVSEFHKNMLQTGPYYEMSIARTDIIHVVDVLRWACGEVKEIKSYVHQFYADWNNSFNAVMEFENGSVGILSGNRATGARYERFEMHGNGIGAYVRAPHKAEIWIDGQPEPTILEEKVLTGSDDMRITYGYRDENRIFIDCIKEDKTPPCSFDDAVKTMELVDLIENGGNVKT